MLNLTAALACRCHYLHISACLNGDRASEWTICQMCACSDCWCKSISRCATTLPSICASGKSAVTMVISGSNPSGICHLGRQTTRKPAGVIGVQEDGERLRGISTTLDLTQFCFKMTRTEKPNGRAWVFSYDHTYLCSTTIKKKKKKASCREWLKSMKVKDMLSATNLEKCIWQALYHI